MHTGPEDDREREWPPLLAILAVFAAGWLLVGPRANVPVIDDWVYAWSVEHFLKTGRLEVLDISAFYPIAQILWGALFALVAGFSFTTLRASTVIVAVVGCCAVYLTLRELGCRRSTSLLGALALAVDPAYFALSFSFMTDVPFTSISTVTLYWYVRAVRRSEANAVWIGSLFAILAFLIRPIGIVLPLAMVPALIWNRKSRLTVPHSPAPLVATLLIMGALQVAMPRLFGPLDWAAIRQDYLRWWFTVPIASYLRWNVEVLFVAVFPLAPLLLASVARARRAIAVCAAALVLAIACRVAVGGLVMPLPRGQTWSLQDIAARSMFDGEVTAPAWSLRAVPLVKVLGLLTVGALLVGARGWRQRLASCLASPRGEPVIIALMVLQAAAINVLWLYNDRYYLVLAPMIAMLAAQALEIDARARWTASALLVVWAAIAISGTRDMLAINDASARVAQELEATGIPPSDIDAGYSLNGWRLYAHPEQLPPGANRRYDVPFVTSNRATPYSITNRPLPGAEVLRVVPLDRSSWQWTRVLFVLRRR